MNQLLSVKNLFEHKIISNESCAAPDKWLKRPDSNGKPDDFGKILKQRDRQENTSKRPENFSQSDKKPEAEEDSLEYKDESFGEKPLREVFKEESSADDTPLVSNEHRPTIEVSAWDPEIDAVLEKQIPENFSAEEIPMIEDKPAEEEVEALDPSIVVPMVEAMQGLKPVVDVPDEAIVADDLPDLDAHKTDLFSVKSEPINTTELNKPAAEELQLASEVPAEVLKENPKMAKANPMGPKIEKKIPTAQQPSIAQSFEFPQNASHLLNLQHFEIWNNVGIKSAPKESDRKGGFVSSGSTVVTEFEDPLHRDPAISSNGSRVAEVLSQKTDAPTSNNSDQHFEIKEAVLPAVQPKVVVNTYETAQREQLETVQGIIATLEQQMDEMKRSRRNSVIVKVDLENGESLNCQVTLARSDVAIRFPALEESFKMQILSHWEALRKFAETRQLNLSEPHFIAQTSL